MRAFYLISASFLLYLLPTYGLAQCGDTLNCLTTVSTFPYFEDFENGPGGWYHAPIDSLYPNPPQVPSPAPYTGGTVVRDTWTFGRPQKTHISQAASGDSCWVNGLLSANYTLREHACLLSPCFDFSALNHPFVSFNINYDTETRVDGAVLQVSLDGGDQWSRVGNLQSGQNWYNWDTIFSNPGTVCSPVNQLGWSGRSQGWQQAIHDLGSLAGEPSVIFRLAFASDFLSNWEGFAFDDFEVKDLGADFLGPDTSSCGPILLTSALGAIGARYLWSTGDTNPSTVTNSSGLYWLQIQWKNQTYRDSIQVTVNPFPTLNLGPDQFFCSGDTVFVPLPQPTFPTQIQVNVYDSSLMQFVPLTNPGPSLWLDSTTTFEVILTDSNSCEARDTLSVTEAPNPALNAQVTHVSCAGNLDGEVRLTVNGIPNNPSVQYLWSDGSSGTSLVNLGPGIYWVDVIEPNLGCMATDTFLITEPPPLQVNSSITPMTSCTQANGSVTLAIMGGTPPYQIFWNGNPVPGPIIPNVNAGQHQLDVVDANTCSFSSQLTIPYLPPSPPQIQQIITTPDFGSQDGTAIAVVSGGTPPFLYDWGVLGLGQNNDTIIGLSAGFDSLGLVDANGCSDFMTYTIPYATGVYPGDADHSQQVDMNDLLPIGIHFGRTGPPRPNASLQWQPQLAPLWGDTLSNGKDLRHTDTDGDGSISLDDTLAVQLNFGQTHNNQRGGANAGVPLRFSMPTTNLSPGDTLTVPLTLGTVDTPVVNLYGLTFTIRYDTALVDSGTAWLSFANSWLGSKNQNLISMYRDEYVGEKISSGAVRFDSTQLNGFGRIADLIVVIDDHIAKREIPFGLTFGEVYAISLDGEEIPLSPRPAETRISTATGIADELAAAVAVYPLPYRQELRVRSPHLRISTARCYQLNGQEVFLTCLRQPEGLLLQLPALSPGMYLLKLQAEQGVIWKKVMIK
jgi:hypothetical protein